MKRLAAALTLVCACVAVQAAPAGLPDFTELVERNAGAVVNISTTQTVKQGRQLPQMPDIPEDDPFYEFFRRFMPPPGGPREYQSRSLGSGFVISADGYILTNAHVVDAADEITVRFNDKRELKGKVIGVDKRTDVALMKVEGSGFPAVRLGKPSQLKVGEWVLAIGSPFGFDSTVTAGIVSAKGRSLPQENYVPFIQTDVAINPGNSGGPLFNMQGEVVGINSQIYSRTGGFMGLSFAIPIDVAMDIADQLRSSGKVTRGRIGVVIQEVTRELAESFGLDKPGGALVSAVEKGGPAEKAGVQPSDVIQKFDGKPVASSADLPRLVAATKPGSKVKLQIWRKGAAKELPIVVGELQEDKTAQRSSQRSEVSSHGVTVADLSPQQQQELGIEGGALIQDVKGAAARAGLRRGDVVQSVNNQPVRDAAGFREAMAKLEKGKVVALLVRRGDGSLFIPFKPDAE